MLECHYRCKWFKTYPTVIKGRNYPYFSVATQLRHSALDAVILLMHRTSPQINLFCNCDLVADSFVDQPSGVFPLYLSVSLKKGNIGLCVLGNH